MTLLRIPEAAKKLGVSRYTVYDLIHQHAIAAVTLTKNGRLRVVEESLDQFINQRMKEQCPEFAQRTV